MSPPEGEPVGPSAVPSPSQSGGEEGGGAPGPPPVPVLHAALQVAQIGGLLLVLLALPLPMMTIRDCSGHEEHFSGLEWTFVEGAPGTLVVLGLMAALAWLAFRRRPEAPDLALLASATRYCGATLAAFLAFMMPVLRALFDSMTVHVGGWMQMAGWGITLGAAATDGLWPVAVEGPDPHPGLRKGSLYLRRAAIVAAPLLVIALAPLAMEPVPEGTPRPLLDTLRGVTAGWVLAGLPLYSMIRAFEARLILGKRGGRALVIFGLVLAGALVAGAVVGAAVAKLDAMAIVEEQRVEALEAETAAQKLREERAAEEKAEAAERAATEAEERRREGSDAAMRAKMEEILREAEPDGR